MDDNQRVYDAKLDVPDEFRPFDLTVNCRNTQAIHREVMKQYEGEVEPEAMGPEGRDIELITADDQPADRRGRARAALRQGGGAAAGRRRALLARLRELGAWRRRCPGASGLPHERGKHGKFVHFSSIRGFKGLESPVVILCELEDLDEETRDQQLYVGMSRARNHCVVVAPDA